MRFAFFLLIISGVSFDASANLLDRIFPPGKPPEGSYGIPLSGLPFMPLNGPVEDEDSFLKYLQSRKGRNLAWKLYHYLTDLRDFAKRGSTWVFQQAIDRKLLDGFDTFEHSDADALLQEYLKGMVSRMSKSNYSDNEEWVEKNQDILRHFYKAYRAYGNGAEFYKALRLVSAGVSLNNVFARMNGILTKEELEEYLSTLGFVNYEFDNMDLSQVYETIDYRASLIRKDLDIDPDELENDQLAKLDSAVNGLKSYFARRHKNGMN